MSLHSFLPVFDQNPSALGKIAPSCSVCNEPVQLEKSKTDERGLAVHEECYLRRIVPSFEESDDF